MRAYSLHENIQCSACSNIGLPMRDEPLEWCSHVTLECRYDCQATCTALYKVLRSPWYCQFRLCLKWRTVRECAVGLNSIAVPRKDCADILRKHFTTSYLIAHTLTQHAINFSEKHVVLRKSAHFDILLIIFLRILEEPFCLSVRTHSRATHCGKLVVHERFVNAVRNLRESAWVYQCPRYYRWWVCVAISRNTCLPRSRANFRGVVSELKSTVTKIVTLTIEDPN